MEDNNHPYKDIPDYRHWRRSVSSVQPGLVDPVVKFDFTIDKSDRVATAGSCFAQHIARYLARSGFNYYVQESGHPLLPEAHRRELGYGLFSARYGNVYTSRQLLQLFERAFGIFTPHDAAWESETGSWFDPYRPSVEPGGYTSLKDLKNDRESHLMQVKQMFKELNVFVFTLGLTETWVNSKDGAAYPICPGVVAGKHKSSEHQFINLSVSDVVADMKRFYSLLKSENNNAKVILTVSPVPLMATMEDRHVIQSTTYSKAVLRVAAEQLTAECDDISYFPSYEIITAPSKAVSYYGDDLRSIQEEGVKHVMTLFLRHVTRAKATALATTRKVDGVPGFEKRMEEIVRVICDEEAL